MNKILSVAGIVLIATFGMAFWLHGNARYSEGKADCASEYIAVATNKNIQAKKSLEKTENETHFMSDSDVDHDLFKLGIMRSTSDY